MADQDKPKSYPKIVKTAWFFLRDRAQQSPTIKITPSMVMATFSLKSQASARDNIVKPLQSLGIIDDEGALTERGSLWRNADTYAQACQQIVETSYPEDLRGIDDVAAVERWFTAQGFGASNARQMTASYKILSEPSIPDEITTPGQKSTGNGKATKKTAKAAAIKSSPTLALAEQPPVTPPQAPPSTSMQPSLQMNLQIHLPSNATAEQIDMIFASMAKHLYGK